MTFKIKTFSNAMKIIEEFMLDGYKVTVLEIMKEFPCENLTDYYKIAIEEKKETDK